MPDQFSRPEITPVPKLEITSRCGLLTWKLQPFDEKADRLKSTRNQRSHNVFQCEVNSIQLEADLTPFPETQPSALQAPDRAGSCGFCLL